MDLLLLGSYTRLSCSQNKIKLVACLNNNPLSLSPPPGRTTCLNDVNVNKLNWRQFPPGHNIYSGHKWSFLNRFRSSQKNLTTLYKKINYILFAWITGPETEVSISPSSSLVFLLAAFLPDFCGVFLLVVPLSGSTLTTLIGIRVYLLSRTTSLPKYKYLYNDYIWLEEKLAK